MNDYCGQKEGQRQQEVRGLCDSEEVISSGRGEVRGEDEEHEREPGQMSSFKRSNSAKRKLIETGLYWGMKVLDTASSRFGSRANRTQNQWWLNLRGPPARGAITGRFLGGVWETNVWVGDRHVSRKRGTRAERKRLW